MRLTLDQQESKGSTIPVYLGHQPGQQRLLASESLEETTKEMPRKHAILHLLGDCWLVNLDGHLIEVAGPELLQFVERNGKVLEEQRLALLALGVLLNIRLELLVLDEDEVRGEHHERA